MVSRRVLCVRDYKFFFFIRTMKDESVFCFTSDQINNNSHEITKLYETLATIIIYNL